MTEESAVPALAVASEVAAAADESAETASPLPTPRPAAPRPPNRPAYEAYLESTQSMLAAKEERRRFLQERLKGLRDVQVRLKTHHPRNDAII